MKELAIIRRENTGIFKPGGWRMAEERGGKNARSGSVIDRQCRVSKYLSGQPVFEFLCSFQTQLRLRTE